MKRVGYIGTGIMGSPMALNLLRAGCCPSIYDIRPNNMQELARAGASVCANAFDVADKSDIIFLMVLTAEDVESVLFGEFGAVKGLQQGNIVVCMSSIPAITTKAIAARLEKVGVSMLDAPVSGGQAGAIAGKLAIMVGGEKPAFDTVLPYFKFMGDNINLVGGHGSGQTAKAANQIIVTLTRAAVGEALLFAKQDGADPEAVRQALMGGLAQSATLETYGPRRTNETNPVEFGSPILKKDINNVVAAAEELGVSLPFSELVRDKYNEFQHYM